MRIGIFGGSFNPPHNMHKNIALDLINNNYLDRVIYVPVGDSYSKEGLVNFKDRFNMLKLMTNNNSSLEVSDISFSDNYKYTYQVMDYFKEKYQDSEIYFICGSDNLKDFDTWLKYQYILNNYKVIVVKRNSDNIDNIIEKYINYKDNIIVAPIIENNISSSKIRDNIYDNDRYLDKNVLEYILKRDLYN